MVLIQSWQITTIDILTAYYIEFINADMMGRVQVVARFLPLFLILPLIASKIAGHTVGVFYPVFLSIEYLIWPVWFYYFSGPEYELLGCFAYLTIYLLVSAFFIKSAQPYSKYFALVYIWSSVVIIFNMIAYISPNLFIIQSFYDGYFNIMSLTMIGLVILGWVAMYDSGNGGSRVHSRNGRRYNYQPSIGNNTNLEKG